MRKLLITATILAATSQVGCFVPIYSSSPDVLRGNSSTFRKAFGTFRNRGSGFWGLDMPDLETPYRTHGGVI